MAKDKSYLIFYVIALVLASTLSAVATYYVNKKLTENDTSTN